MDIGNRVENVCLRSKMYVGCEMDNSVIVEYNGCVRLSGLTYSGEGMGAN